MYGEQTVCACLENMHFVAKFSNFSFQWKGTLIGLWFVIVSHNFFKERWIFVSVWVSLHKKIVRGEMVIREHRLKDPHPSL